MFNLFFIHGSLLQILILRGDELLFGDIGPE